MQRLDGSNFHLAAGTQKAITLSSDQITTLYATNNLSAGISAAERLVERQRTRLGERHLDTALAVACSPSGWRGQDVIKTPRANSSLPFRFGDDFARYRFG
jgi:hypothetical protein